jgi:hypothetical protein
MGLLGIIGYMVYLLKITPMPVRTVPKIVIVTNTVTQIAVRKVNSTNNPYAALLASGLNWTSIESTNYTAYITNLRYIGCPEETIRDIILTDVAKAYSKRRSALIAQSRGEKYWLPGPNEAGGDPQVQRQLAALDQDESRLVRDLLNVDFQTEMAKYWQDNDILDQRSLSFLPADKQDAVRGVNAKYDALEQEIYSKAKGEVLEQDEQRVRAIESQKEADLAKILSPDELNEYQLRNSSTAASLRSQLSPMNVSEDEFRKIFAIQKTYENQIGAGDQSPAGARAQEAAQQALNEELRKTLGDKRYNEYVRSQDSDYQSLTRLTDRFDLPKDVAANVYNMKVVAEQQKARLDANPALTYEQRQNALNALARETEASMAQAMGANAYQAYSKSSSGWMQSLTYVPPPPPETTAPAQNNASPFPPFPPLPPGFPPVIVGPTPGNPVKDIR